MKKRGLGLFQERNTVSISVDWDIPLWDKARQVAYERHISLSTLVWEAMKAYLDAVELPSWARVRKPEEYAGVRNWRVQRLVDIEKPGNTLKLTRAETVHKEFQGLLKDLSETKDSQKDSQKPAERRTKKKRA